MLPRSFFSPFERIFIIPSGIALRCFPGALPWISTRVPSRSSPGVVQEFSARISLRISTRSFSCITFRVPREVFPGLLAESFPESLPQIVPECPVLFLGFL